jgi:FAR-17a/AIG1-like protein
VEQCYKNNGFYPYPIFDEAGFEGRVGLFAMSAVVMIATTFALKQVYGSVNGWEVPGKVAPPKKKRGPPKTPRKKAAKKE